MEFMQWQIKNQKMLQQVFKENRSAIKLSKNRLEKFRARVNKNKELESRTCSQ